MFDAKCPFCGKKYFSCFDDWEGRDFEDTIDLECSCGNVYRLERSWIECFEAELPDVCKLCKNNSPIRDREDLYIHCSVGGCKKVRRT